jgi:hypothetical protein
MVPILLLTVLWALWVYFFIGVSMFAYAFTHSISGAVLPGSPIGLDRRETAEWVEAVALVYGTPLVLTALTWWWIRSGNVWFRRRPSH